MRAAPARPRPAHTGCGDGGRAQELSPRPTTHRRPSQSDCRTVAWSTPSSKRTAPPGPTQRCRTDSDGPKTRNPRNSCALQITLPQACQRTARQKEHSPSSTWTTLVGATCRPASCSARRAQVHGTHTGRRPTSGSGRITPSQRMRPRRTRPPATMRVCGRSWRYRSSTADSSVHSRSENGASGSVTRTASWTIWSSSWPVDATSTTIVRAAASASTKSVRRARVRPDRSTDTQLERSAGDTPRDSESSAESTASNPRNETWGTSEATTTSKARPPDKPALHAPSNLARRPDRAGSASGRQT